jgi:hypothetical protein
MLAILLYSGTGMAQSAPPGIYIIYTAIKKSKCEQAVKMLIGGGRVCISKKPILDVSEIESVSDIINDTEEKVSYINVLISSTGVEILNKIFEGLPNSQFVFVLENSGVGQFSIPYNITTPIMRVGADVDLNNLQLIHSRLKKAVQRSRSE